MVKLIQDNFALSGLVGFFLVIGLFKTIDNSTYKQTLPVKFDDSFTAEQKQQIRRSVRWHILAWQLDFQRPTKRATICVVHRPFTRHGSDKILWGVCFSGLDKIIVYAGENLETPVLYHELCHLNIDQTNDHEGERWVRWRRRNAEITSLLMGRERDVIHDD